MEDSQVLYNAKDDILAVGFDTEGNVIPSQFAQGSDVRGTLQMNADIVHTKDTYDGDDVDILDFFSRDKLHPEYGVLYVAQNKDLMLNILALQASLNLPFADMTETPHQSSMQHRITRAILTSLIGLDTPTFDVATAINEINTILSPLTSENVAIGVSEVTFQNITMVSAHSDINHVNYLWFRNEDGTWWYNNILNPELITATSSCPISPGRVSINVSMTSNIPDNVVGDFFMVTLSETKTQNISSTQVTIEKLVPVSSAPLQPDME